MQKYGKFYGLVLTVAAWNASLFADAPAGWKQITPNLIRSDDGSTVMGSDSAGYRSLAITGLGEMTMNGYLAPDVYRSQYAGYLCDHPEILLQREIRILFVTSELDAKHVPAEKAEACFRMMRDSLRKHENESIRDQVVGSAVVRPHQSYLDRLQQEVWGTGEKPPSTTKAPAATAATHDAKGYDVAGAAARSVAEKDTVVKVPDVARGMMEDAERELKKGAEPDHSLDIPAFLNYVYRLQQAKVAFREIEKKIVALKLPPALQTSALTAADAVYRNYQDLNELRKAKPEYAEEWKRRTSDLAKLSLTMFTTQPYMLWLQSDLEKSPSLLEALPKLLCPLGKGYIQHEVREAASEYLASHPGNDFAIALSRAARFHSSSPKEISADELVDYKKYRAVVDRDCPTITNNWLQSFDFPRHISFRHDRQGNPIIGIKEGTSLDNARKHLEDAYGAQRVDKLIAHNVNQDFRPVGARAPNLKKPINYGKFLEAVVKSHQAPLTAAASAPANLDKHPSDLKPKVSATEKEFSALAQDRSKFDIKRADMSQNTAIKISECSIDDTLFLGDPVDSVKMQIPVNGVMQWKNNKAMKLGFDKLVASGAKPGVNLFRPKTPEEFVEAIAEFSKKFPDRRIPCVSFLGHGCPLGAVMCTDKVSLAFNGVNPATRALIRRVNESGAEIDKLKFLSCLVADGVDDPRKENVMLALAGGLHGQPEITGYTNMVGIPTVTTADFSMTGWAENFAGRAVGKEIKVKLKDAHLTEKPNPPSGNWVGVGIATLPVDGAAK